MNRNLSETGLNEAFENGLLDIMRLESVSDNNFQEKSASMRVLNSLIRFMQSLRKNDDSVISCIEFKLKVI